MTNPYEEILLEEPSGAINPYEAILAEKPKAGGESLGIGQKALGFAKDLYNRQRKDKLEFGEALSNFDFREGFLGRAGAALGTSVGRNKEIERLMEEHDWSRELATEEVIRREGKPAEKPQAPPIGETLKQLGKMAVERPGMTLGELVKVTGEDFWMLLIPEFGAAAKLGQVAAKLNAKLGKAGRVVGRAAELGTVGAGVDVAVQTSEKGAGLREEIDWRAAQTSGAMWAALGGLGEMLRRSPGMIPEGELKGGVSRKTTAEILKAFNKEQGITTPSTPAEITALKNNIDLNRNAYTKAYDLAQRGASVKEVEGVRKTNPLVGEHLDRLMEMRRMAGEAFETRQGEVLPPEGPPAQPRLPGPPAAAGAIGEGTLGLPLAVARYRESYSPEYQAAKAREAGEVDAVTPPEEITVPPIEDLPEIRAPHRESKLIDDTPVVYFSESAGDRYIVRAENLDTGEVLGEASFIKHRQVPDAYEGLVKVAEPFRRKGLATELYDYAQKEMGLKIAPSATQTEAGKAFTTSRLARGEAGNIDPRLAAMLGLGTAGALTGALISEDPFEGAVGGAALGAALPLLLRKTVLSDAANAVKSLEVASEAITHPRLKFAARRLERDILVKTDERLRAGDPFVRAVQKLPEDLRQHLILSMRAGDKARVTQALTNIGSPELAQQYIAMRRAYDQVGKEMKDLGLIRGELPEYIHLAVKDREGLLKQLELPVRDVLEKELLAADRKAISTRGYGLDEVEQTQLINRHLKGFRPSGAGKAGYQKSRVFDEVTPEMLPYYAGLEESYHAYMRQATQAIEVAKFFGKDLVKTEAGGITLVDIDASIGGKINRMLAKKEITTEQASELGKVLRERWLQGEVPMNVVFQSLRDLGYQAYLSQVPAMIRQLSEPALAAYAYGLRPTLQATYRMLTGKVEIPVRELGVSHIVAEEVSNPRLLARTMPKVMKGFELADRFGKQAIAEAALIKMQQQAGTPKGRQQLAEKYGEALGDDFPQLLTDLQAKRMTDDVNATVFNELSAYQPTSKLEMTRTWLKNPNGRLLWQMKGWMMKQFSIMRRDAFKEIQKGNVGKGLGNLARYSFYLGTAGAAWSSVADFIMGRPFELDTPDVVEALAKNFSFSKYTTDQMRKGRPVQTYLQSSLTPAGVHVLDDLVKMDKKTLRDIPVIGQLLYAHALGGKEEFAERQEKEELRQEREDIGLEKETE